MDPLVCQVEHLGLAVAEHLAERLIDNDAAFGAESVIPTVFGESAAKQLLALAQRLLGQLAVADVLDLASQRIALAVARQREADQPPDGSLTVLVQGSAALPCRSGMSTPRAVGRCWPADLVGAGSASGERLDS